MLAFFLAREIISGNYSEQGIFLFWISRGVFGFISVKITVVRKFLDYLFDWLLSKKDSATRINLILSSCLCMGLG
jgi:Kef-type K+ transport system membrane component KefB